MGQYLGQDNIPQFVVASATSLTLAATNNGFATRITIGGQQYALTTGLSINTAVTGIGGLDTGSVSSNTLYYVYAVVSSGTVGMVLSTSSTAPTGFTQYANIGRVRTYQGSSNLAFSANWYNGKLIVGQSPSAPNFYIPTMTGLGSGGITSINNGSSVRYWFENNYLMMIGSVTKDGVSGSGSSDILMSLPYSNANIDVSVLPNTSAISSQSNRLGSFNLVGGSPAQGEVIPSNTGNVRFRRTNTNAELTGSDFAANNNLTFGILAIPLVELIGLFI